MKKRIKFKLIVMLLLVVIISVVPILGLKNGYYIIKAGNKKSKGLNIAYHTENEIRAFIKAHPANFDAVVEYEKYPSGNAPYSLGKIKTKTLKSALNTLNQMRYIAGLSSNVELNYKYVKFAQGASMVSYANNFLSHYPVKPAGMSQKLYSIGAKGALNCNLGNGYNNIDTSIVFGYMEDGDSSNIGRLGHRRSILNPSMKTVGFGYFNKYTATYVFDRTRTSASEYGVVWPAQNMPVDYFNEKFPWSISMGYKVDASKIKIKLTRLTDNKTWKFSKSKSDGYFSVNNDNYGLKGCIIFRPKGIGKYFAGEKFKITITGLKTPVSYEVSFFKL